MATRRSASINYLGPHPWLLSQILKTLKHVRKLDRELLISWNVCQPLQINSLCEAGPHLFGPYNLVPSATAGSHRLLKNGFGIGFRFNVLRLFWKVQVFGRALCANR